jgi:hypothetical protein
MSICYEFALECQIKRDVSREVTDTLRYMTRSQDYDFDTPRLDHPLFEETSHWKETWNIRGRKSKVIRYEWRTIITNQPREGEQYLAGEFGSQFQDNQLSCRRLSRDDEFDNVWWLLFPWLASISESMGFVGYYRGDFEDYPKLIQFLNGKVSIYELIPKDLSQTEVSEFYEQETTLSLDMDTLSNPIQQELIRQTENPKMSLETYLSSVVAKKYTDVDVLLAFGQL